MLITLININFAAGSRALLAENIDLGFNIQLGFNIATPILFLASFGVDIAGSGIMAPTGGCHPDIPEIADVEVTPVLFIFSE